MAFAAAAEGNEFFEDHLHPESSTGGLRYESRQLKFHFSPEAHFAGIFSEPCADVETPFSDSKDPECGSL